MPTINSSQPFSLFSVLMVVAALCLVSFVAGVDAAAPATTTTGAICTTR